MYIGVNLLFFKEKVSPQQSICRLLSFLAVCIGFETYTAMYCFFWSENTQLQDPGSGTGSSHILMPWNQTRNGECNQTRNKNGSIQKLGMESFSLYLSLIQTYV